MSQRFQYRTPDGITHLWTQDEIDIHIQAMRVPVIDMPSFVARDITMQVEQMGHVKPSLSEDEPVSVQEEAALTVKILHDLLYHPYKTIDHETVQDLLSRIDTMAEPLKELVQAMEEGRVPQAEEQEWNAIISNLRVQDGLKVLAEGARQQIRDGYVEDGGFGGDAV